jgi:hypothetical protein
MRQEDMMRHLDSMTLPALAAAGLLFTSLHASPARAQEVLAAASASVRESPGGEFAADLRVRFEDGLQLGLQVEGGVFDAVYPGGYSERGAGTLRGSGVVLARLLAAGELTLDFRLVTGARYMRLFAASQGPSSEALRWTNELAVLTHVRLGDAWLLRVGAILGFDLELSPVVDLADQTQLLTLGVGWAPARDVMVFVSGDGGGSYGFDGDNAKVIFRGTLGVRVALDSADARSAF